MTSMFFGQFIISLILIAMAISAEFTLEEKRAFRDMKDIEYFKKRAQLAGHIITVSALIFFCNRELKNTLKLNEEGDDDDQRDVGYL